MGDLILSTPAIASFRRSFPEAHITIACSRHNAAVVERNPDVDGVEVVPGGVRPAAFGRRFAGSCDLAVALAPRTADFQLIAGTRAPRRVGYTYVRRRFARLAARLYLTDCAISQADPELSDRDPSRPVRHEVDQVLDLVPLAGGNALVRDLVLPVDDRDRSAVAHVPAGGIAFHLAERWLSAGSTQSSTLELIARLRRFGRPLVVTFGTESRALAESVRAAGVADAVVGDLPFSAWAAVFEKSACVVTVDTGATHVASAMRRPVVVVFERRYFALSSREWAPYRVAGASVCKPSDASDSSLQRLRDEVVRAVESLLLHA